LLQTCNAPLASSESRCCVNLVRMAQEAELARAYALLREGKLSEAEAVCRAELGKAPRSATALHLLGLVRKDSGDANAGERLLRESIGLEPARAEFRANLANLLRRLGRYAEAERSYREALGLDPQHRPARLGLARTLNDLGQHQAAEGESRVLLASQPRDAEAWSLLAGALRGQNQLSEAEVAYRKAIEARPNFGPAHHNLGSLLSQLDRAEESLESLMRAQHLGVSGFALAFNRGRALMALYRVDEAEQAFAEAVALEPRHTEAQLNLARVRFMRGDPRFARDIAAAAAASRGDVGLQLLFGTILRRAEDPAGAEALLRDVLRTNPTVPQVRSALADLLHETGRLKEAESEALEAATAAPDDARIVETLVAILLSRGKPDDASPFIRAQRTRYPLEQSWLAYEATAARLAGQPLYRELFDYPRLVQSYNVEPPAPWKSIEELNAALVSALATRHPFATHPLDQSLRNGSQSARSLLTDPEPAIQAILRAFEAPIDSYRRTIGTHPSHPLTSRNRTGARFSGAWSVQLRREGFHVNHFHPQGWISSAYYVSVPSEVADASLMSGWIKFGEPRFPIPGGGPECFIRPKPGLLVLFPSYMWHGTNPIHGPDVRTAIAFDAIPG
jgi:tetratricopeptide (TPR) repeat protein